MEHEGYIKAPPEIYWKKHTAACEESHLAALCVHAAEKQALPRKNQHPQHIKAEK